MVRLGFFISPLTLSADSNPAKAKNSNRAAAAESFNRRQLFPLQVSGIYIAKSKNDDCQQGQ